MTKAVEGLAARALVWAARAGLVLMLVASSVTGCAPKSVATAGAPTDAIPDAPVDAFKEVAPCIEPAPTFAEVQTLFDQHCISCHTVGSALDLTAGTAYANLVAQPAPASESCGGVLVVPGSPEASYLYIKLSNAHPCSGQQMPRTDIYSIPLPQCLQQLVRDWIAGGARPAGNASDAAPMMDSPSADAAPATDSGSGDGG